MRIIVITTLCLLFAFCSFAQIGDVPEPETVTVEQLYLAKDDGEGGVGEAAEYFLTTDIPIYCIVQLNSTKPATVKMNLVAVDVAGVQAETRVITISYKTNGRQNRVSFTGKPEGAWTAGNYRIDIYIDDKLARGQSFDIKKTPFEIQKIPARGGKFALPKPKPKPRIVKSTRRN